MIVDARAIANEFLRLAWEEGAQVEPLKLIKLVYIAHGWHMALDKGPLISDSVEAWQYGPVVPSLHHVFGKYGDEPILTPAFQQESQGDTSRFNPLTIDDCAQDGNPQEVISHVELVWTSYKRFSGLELSSITHGSGTPWTVVTGDGQNISKDGNPLIIGNELIESHYRELRRERGVA